jgi:hypothetical protein
MNSTKRFTLAILTYRRGPQSRRRRESLQEMVSNREHENVNSDGRSLSALHLLHPGDRTRPARQREPCGRDTSSKAACRSSRRPLED